MRYKTRNYATQLAFLAIAEAQVASKHSIHLLWVP